MLRREVDDLHRRQRPPAQVGCQSGVLDFVDRHLIDDRAGAQIGLGQALEMGFEVRLDLPLGFGEETQIPRIAELAGMVPVQIEAAELSQALATGVAEAFISSGSTGVDSKVWESLTHFYDVQAWLPRNTVFVNKDAYNGLDDAGKKAIMDCGAAAEAAGTAKSQELTSQYLKTLAENGMKVSGPSDQLKSDLKGFGAIMTDEWIAAAGDKGKAIVDAYKAM